MYVLGCKSACIGGIFLKFHMSHDQASGHVVRNFILHHVMTAFIVEYSFASYCRRQETS